MKSTQGNMQKCITWPKEFGKDAQEWCKACVENGIQPRKLNILVKTR
jgi:hypothetical protein